MAVARADWIAWRRLENSDDAWEQIKGLTLTACTAGEAWHEVQKRMFLAVVPDAELNQRFEYAVTRLGETPEAATAPRPTGRSQTYLDRMMRARPK